MPEADFSLTDLSNCDREPIHAPGGIQPHGFLFVLDPNGWKVVGASTNIRDYFWREASAVIGSLIDALLGENILAALERARAQPDFASRTRFVMEADLDVNGKSRRFVLLAHASDSWVILEGEAATELSSYHPEQEIQGFLSRLGAIEAVEDLHRLAVTEVRRITGFDRVLLYQFDADWNGTVIAEDRNANLPAYLNQRFPASDIPKQARDLYLRNRLRLIPANTYKPVPIALRAGTRPAELDLSLAVLRDVSPIHLEYMRNMGTGSSMSIAVMRGQELWGLISCHSREPRFIPFPRRTACDLLGQFFSLQLAGREQANALTQRMELTRLATKLIGDLAQEGDFGLTVEADDLLRFAGAAGAAIVCDREILLYGRCPAREAVQNLARHVLNAGQPLAFWNQLGEQFPAMGLDPAVAGGMLAVASAEPPEVAILWFRPEIIQVIEWGGEPRKAIEAHGAGRALHPRRSFEIWRETVRGCCQPWEPGVIAAAKNFREALLRLVLRRRS